MDVHGGMHQTGTRDYLKGALWVYPSIAVLLALAVGSVLSQIEVSEDSWLDPLLFQGTADDARNLLIGISGTMMTVIALVLGLTLVALQLSATQYSPRLLRSFLRDRTNQVVLGVFTATFVYSTAGLYTVGVESGQRTDEYPRLAVTLALALLVASLVVLVYFVHHISHAIQIDEVMARVQANTMRVIENDLPTEQVVADPPVRRSDTVAVPAGRSGYVQTFSPAALCRVATAESVVVGFVPMVGEHVIEGLPLAQVWRVDGTARSVSPALAQAVTAAVRIGYERTAEQDVALGVRQMTDIAVKALSPAINDPYTAIQAIDHTAVLLAALASRPLGHQLLPDESGTPRVVIPGRDLEYYVELATGQVRRYGSTEPRVLRALVRILASTAAVCRDDASRAVVHHHVRLVAEAAEIGIAQADDLRPVVAAAEEVLGT